MPTPKPKDYPALKKLWYAKLKKTGFKDLEQDEDTLKEWSFSSFIARNINPVRYESTLEYYRLAGQFLYEHEFADPVEKLIWRLHSEGKPLLEISYLLKKKHIKLGKDSVNKRVKALKKLMVDKCCKKQT